MSKKKNRHKHVMEAYEENYKVDQKDATQDQLESLRNEVLAGYCVKTIKSGPILEVEAYPYWHIPQGQRKKIRKGSRQSQINLNDKNRRKHVMRMIATNFRKLVDLWMHMTYAPGRLPADPEQAKKDMVNYIRRLKNWLKKRPEYKDFELKYIYVTEHTRDGRKVRAHHHMVINFPDRNVAEELWNGRGRANSRRLQPDDYGYEGIARYLIKEKSSKTTKSYTPSRNLTTPTVTTSFTKLTRRKAEKIAKNEVSAQETFEKMYKDYQFNDIEVKFSDYVSGAYLYVRMRKIDPEEPRRRTSSVNKKHTQESEERVPFSLFHAAVEREKEKAEKRPVKKPEKQEELGNHE